MTFAALYRLIPIVRDQLAAPFDLISEGPHLSTINAIRDGYNIYAPSSYLDVPFQITPYVPLVHSLIAALPADPANPFWTGRVVAMLFMLAAAGTLFLAAPAHRSLSMPLLALGCFLLIRPVTGNVAYLRCDSAALFFSVAAIVTVARAPDSTAMLSAAALLSALAIASKQSFSAAAAASVLYLVLRGSLSRALAFAVVVSAVLGLLALVAWLVWGTGFWFCVFLPVTHYPRDWPSFLVHWQDMLKQPVFVLVVAAVVCASIYAFKHARPGPLTASPYFIYLLISTAAQMLPLSGIGASNHYFFEPVLASLLWVVFVGAAVPLEGVPAALVLAALTILSACLWAEFRYANPAEYRYTTRDETAQHVAARNSVADRIHALGLDDPRMLNLKNSPVTFDYPGRMSINDPYLYFVLWEAGALSTASLLRAIERQDFDAVFVAPGLVSGRGQGTKDPIQNVLRVLFQHYRLAIRGAEVNVLTRIGPDAHGLPEPD